jgi:hypothetical protein
MGASAIIYRWRAYISEIKERRRWKIRTPEQLWKALADCVRFVVGETQKNPDFVSPEQFLEVLNSSPERRIQRRECRKPR